MFLLHNSAHLHATLSALGNELNRFAVLFVSLFAQLLNLLLYVKNLSVINVKSSARDMIVKLGPGLCSDSLCSEYKANCKAPHFINICQPPAPICGIVCDEPSCDWKCSKTSDWPESVRELMCDNSLILFMQLIVHTV